MSFNAFAVFNSHLYVATSNTITGVEIWRSASGDAGSWSQVNVDGFGSANTGKDVTMGVFQGNLYVGLGRNEVAELWRSDDGLNWSPVFIDGLGNPENTHVSAIAEFDDYVYIGLRNLDAGGEVWRSQDGMRWEPVFVGGLGNPANQRPYGLIVFEGELYLVFSNLNTGAEVWRSRDGLSWQPVSEPGWGDADNVFGDYFNKAGEVFHDALFIGTINIADGGEIWRLLKQHYLPLVSRP